MRSYKLGTGHVLNVGGAMFMWHPEIRQLDIFDKETERYVESLLEEEVELLWEFLSDNLGKHAPPAP